MEAGVSIGGDWQIGQLLRPRPIPVKSPGERQFTMPDQGDGLPALPFGEGLVFFAHDEHDEFDRFGSRVCPIVKNIDTLGHGLTRSEADGFAALDFKIQRAGKYVGEARKRMLVPACLRACGNLDENGRDLSLGGFGIHDQLARDGGLGAQQGRHLDFIFIPFGSIRLRMD